MALKATILDEENTPHLLIGLSRENVETLEKGEVFVLPQGQNLPLTDKSDIVVIFEETDEALVQRMKAHMPSEPKARHRHGTRRKQ
jgi:hypothetical protein